MEVRNDFGGKGEVNSTVHPDHPRSAIKTSYHHLEANEHAVRVTEKRMSSLHYFVDTFEVVVNILSSYALAHSSICTRWGNSSPQQAIHNAYKCDPLFDHQALPNASETAF